MAATFVGLSTESDDIMTTSYLDSYWEAADMAAFLPLLATQPNIIGPVMGQPEVAGS